MAAEQSPSDLTSLKLAGSEAGQARGAAGEEARAPRPFGRLYFFFDRADGPRDRLLPRWLFLRALGLVYFSAFFALAFQILGLIGSGGVLPVGQFLAAVRPLGRERFWVAPSLLWFVHGAPGALDHALIALVWAGLIASVLVVLNILPRPALLVCFLCFLSFVVTAQDFSQYQSDGMLLEAGFLALFVAPAGLRPRWGSRSLATRAAYFLLLWEWFRIYFESGVVKLASGDPTWRNLTAMYEYYQNGPLPTWIGWYLQHLPFWFHRLTAGATLAMELVLVFLAFLPRRWRLACFVIVTFWQIGVISTANYAFLNYLVLILGFLLLDDRALIRFVPERWRAGLTPDSPVTLLHEPERSVASESPSILSESPSILNPPDTVSSRPEAEGRSGETPVFREEPRVPDLPAPPHRLGLRRHPREVLRALRIAFTAVGLTWIAYATTLPLIQMFWPTVPLPNVPVAALEPFRIANTYGLFANMTPHRYEIEFQGSDDNLHWTAYPFRYKPQDPYTRPRVYAPYQPRFDWNLWFASLTSWEQAPIVPRTEIRLLEGSQQTLGLFAGNPFRAHPPRFVRAVLWQYWFSTPEQKRTEGLWWRRSLLGTYAPTITRTPGGKFAAVAVPQLNGPPE